MVSVATSTDNPNINNVMDEYCANPTLSSSHYSQNQNYDNSMISNYSTSTAAKNDVAPPPPYMTTYATSSNQRPLAQHQITSTSGGTHTYPSTYGSSPAQPHHMDTPSTSQLQRTINRTLLGGNESTMLSEQHQQHPGFFSSGGRETTIC